MRLLSEIEKDSKQFMRERRTLILLIVAPLLVLFIMGAIFSGSSTLVGKGTIGVCDLDRSNSSSSFISGIENGSDVIDYSNSTNCSSIMENDVRSGKIDAGLVIPSGFESGIENGNTQTVSMILDNSHFQVAPSLEAFVDANVQGMNKQVGTQFILSVWQRLDNASSELETLSSDVNDTRNSATVMETDLENTTNSLTSLNISSIRDELLIANSTVANTSISLDEADSNLTNIQSEFTNYTIALNQTESDLLEINGTLSNVSSDVNAAKASVNCSDIVFIAYCLSIDSINASVASAQQTVEQRLDQIRQAQLNLQNANTTIQEFKSNIASAKIEAANSQANISSMMAFVDELQNSRDEALQTIANVDSSLSEMVTNTYKLDNIITESRNQISEITSSSPEFIISPMIVASNNLFGNKPFFEFMLPSIIPLILMFVALFLASTSLVKERYGGTLERVYASQVDPFKYAAVKVISYSVVLIPAALLLALIASVVYNAFPISDINTWLYVVQDLALLIMTFVSLGVLIAIYSESEATAFLASLVVGLPLLFLSGLLFPFEFMPPIVSFFGIVSPLTQSILSMQATLLYYSPQLVSSFALLIYAVVFTALAGISLKR